MNQRIINTFTLLIPLLLCVGLSALLIFQLKSLPPANVLAIEEEHISSITLAAYTDRHDKNRVSLTLTEAAEISAFCDLWNHTWTAQIYPHGSGYVQMTQGDTPLAEVILHFTDGREQYYDVHHIYIFDEGATGAETVGYYTFAAAKLNFILETHILAHAAETTEEGRAP